jgi:NAD(P)-dependent dehydrogenase (short-subunit alcohol dehydrogenase family)
VEVVVNNAGWDDFMPFIATSEEFWDKILDINFKGALRVTQAALPGMIERKFGRIINIGSDAGRVGSSLEASARRSRSSPPTPRPSSPARPAATRCARWTPGGGKLRP